MKQHITILVGETREEAQRHAMTDIHRAVGSVHLRIGRNSHGYIVTSTAPNCRIWAGYYTSEKEAQQACNALAFLVNL